MAGNTLTQEEVAHRRGRVVELRRQRLPWDRIGADLGVSPQRAHQIYKAALAEFPASQLAEHRQEELELVDQAVGSLLAIAADDTILDTEKGERPRTSTRTRVEAWSAVRGWAEHRAKLLGIYAPTKSSVEVITKDAFAADLERMAAELGNSDVIDAEEVPDERVKQLAKGAGENDA